MDIRAAFDTIKQKKVLQVVERLLDENHDYCLMMYALLLPPASKGSQASARRLYKTRAVVADHALAKFERHIRELAEPLRNAVVLDLFRPKPISREECMELLRTHIQRNVWQVR
jgi:telomerase reverse transcriptase